MNERDLKRYNTKYVIQEGEDACWLWNDYLDKDGYGEMKINYKNKRAHRISLYHHTQDAESFNNTQILACHSCRNKHCVNPQHLSWGNAFSNSSTDKTRDGTHNNGIKNYNHKLTETQVREIRTRAYKFQKDLAIEYGVSRNCISGIISRKYWKHI